MSQPQPRDLALVQWMGWERELDRLKMRGEIMDLIEMQSVRQQVEKSRLYYFSLFNESSEAPSI
jgi:hypothetical protein